jgi:hypothetical protein
MELEQMHFTVRQAVDRLDSEQMDDLHPAQIDHYLNLAQDLEVDYRLSKYNSKQEGFEASSKRIEDINILLVKSPTDIQPAITPVEGLDIYGTYYYFNLSSLEQDYLQLTNIRACIYKSGCPEKFINLKPLQDDDLNTVMSDYHLKPDYAWGIGYYSINPFGDEQSLFAYTGGEYSIHSLYPHYIRKPKRIYIGGYNSLDGTTTVTNCELTRIHQQICDRAVALIKEHILDPSVNLAQQIKIFNEN